MAVSPRCHWCNSEKMAIYKDIGGRKSMKCRIGMTIKVSSYFEMLPRGMGRATSTVQLCQQCESAFLDWAKSHREKFK